MDDKSFAEYRAKIIKNGPVVARAAALLGSHKCSSRIGR